MAELLERLNELNQSDIYPFHMPGHKRNRTGGGFDHMFGIDITEIEGFDNLHHATGILKRMQDEAARLYGVMHTFFLVNGSTCGIQAGISASVRNGKKLLVARNCHKSVYNTCLLRRIDTVYVYPSETDSSYILGDIKARDVAKALDDNEDIDAVIVTSPNYDGVVSDVAEIAKIVHDHGAILIVDEAHGAHLPFSTCFPRSAVRCNADIIIHSLHKTLPSPTQTALLHVNTERVDLAKLQEFLAIYQTSSPSYVLMAAMQQCIEETSAKKEEWFEALAGRLDRLYDECSNLRHIGIFSRRQALQRGIYDFDKSKILIFPQNNGLNGEQLYEILLRRYHLQMEMASAGYVMGLASVSDTDEGFDRLIKALRDIDRQIGPDGQLRGLNDTDQGREKVDDHGTIPRNVDELVWDQKQLMPPQAVPMHEAYDMAKEKIGIEDAEGRISGEFAYLYPPGIPMITPGEIITKEWIGMTRQYLKLGLPLQGLRDYTCSTIEVISLYTTIKRGHNHEKNQNHMYHRTCIPE